MDMGAVIAVRFANILLWYRGSSRTGWGSVTRAQLDLDPSQKLLPKTKAASILPEASITVDLKIAWVVII